ncbi:MAG: ArsR/SmtB family transcription factor [Phycisphaerae bacterium]
MLQPGNDDDRVWRALSDERRRRMLDFLSAAPMTTGELVTAFKPLSRTGVMKHLDVLVAAGLVLVRWEGRVRWNHFNPVPVDRICRRWMDARRSTTVSALERLRTVAEDLQQSADAESETEATASTDLQNTDHD